MLIPTEPVWIDTDEALAELCSRWRQQAAIAVDTEFMRSSTFYPIAGLIQIGDGRGCYLIDPLAIRALEPLRELMLDEQVTKVFHSCSEDLEVFQCLIDCVPSPIFDTQIAAAFAGFGFSIGYAGLVKATLLHDIPKEETRSDWLQRPLSVAQLKYAALDVAHMLVVYGKLLQILKGSDRLDWVKDDCAELVRQAREPEDFSVAWKKVGLAWKLRSAELAVLRDLCIWRETEARARDIPRNRLIREAPLWELARKQPEDIPALQHIEDIPQRTLQQDGETLLAIIQGARHSSPDSWPQRPEPPLAKSEAPLMRALKNCTRERAEALELPAEVLVRKKEYEFIVRSGMRGKPYQLPERLHGWRYPIIGQSLLEVTRQPLTGADEEEAS